MNRIRQSIALIAFPVILLMSLPSHAVVITSGCASASACSLTELYAGGSISINDVVFDNWIFNFSDGDALNTDQVMVAGVDETASGNPGESTVGLDVNFSPELLVEYIEYDFDFTASIVGSTRQLIGAGLTLLDSTVTGDGFVQVESDLVGTGVVLSTDNNNPNDSANLAGLSSILLDSDIQMETFDNNLVGLSQFNYEFTIMGDSTSVPEPSALLLLISILGMILCRRSYNS